MNLFNLFAKISIDDKDYKSKVNKAQKKFADVGDSISSMNKKFLGVSAAIGGVGAVAAKFGMDFEAQMSKVGAISGATGKDFENLTIKAKEMGQKTKFSATESGQAFEYMAMAGWKTGDMLDGIEGIMNLAAASGEDLAAVSDIVTDAMTAFGLSADKAGHFADVLATASSNSNTNVGLLGESFKYVAPLAGSLGYSIEDTSKALGLMANAGIKGSMSGTALKNILVNMTKPTDAVESAMNKLGLSMTNTDGSMKSLDEVMLMLRGSLRGLTKEQQAQYASTIAGKEGLSGLLAIVNASDEDFNKLSKAIGNADGSAVEMADTMQNNLKGSITILGSSFEALGLAAYDKFGKQAKKAVDGVIDWLNKLTEKLSNGELDGAISGIASALAGIGTALLVFNVVHTIQDFINVFKGLEATTKLATLAQKAYNLVMAANPLVLVITLIASLVAALVTLIATNENVRIKLVEIWTAVKQFFIDVWNGIANFFTETIPRIVGNIVDWFAELPDKILEILVKLKDFIMNKINEIVSFFTDTIPKIIGDIINWFNDLPYKIGEILGKLLGYIIKGWQKIFDFFTETIPEWIMKIINWFAELPEGIAKWLAETFNKVVAWGSNMLSKAAEIGMNFINKLINFIKTLPQKVYEWLVNTISKVIEFGKNLGNKAIEIGGDFVRLLIDAVKELPKKFFEIGTDIVKGVWEGIKSMATWITDKVKGFFTGIVDGVKGVLGIHSPSRVFKGLGKFTMEGFEIGISDNAELPLKANEGIFNEMVKESKGFANEMFGTLTQAKNMIYNDSRGTERIEPVKVVKEESPIIINQHYNKPINEVESARLTRNEIRKLTLGVI